MNTRSTRWILAVLFLVCWGSFFYLPPDSIDRVAIEDGPVENASALFWLCSSMLMGATFARSRVIWHLLLAIIFFLCFGEEVSWGQRVLGFSTPEYFQHRNIQGEFNIHNLEFFDRRGSSRPGIWQNFFSLGRMFSIFWFSYFCLLPRIISHSVAIKAMALRLRIPIIDVLFGPFLIANYAVFKYFEVLHPEVCSVIGWTDRASMSNLLGEAREFYEASAILLIAYWEFKRYRRPE